MVDIKYRQERINFLFILVPAVFIAVGLFMMVLSLVGKSDSSQGTLVSVLFSLIFVLAGGFILFVSLKRALRDKNEVVDLRKNGRELPAEIKDIEEHVEVTHSEDGSHRTYYYSFIVQYTDPDTFEPRLAESVITYTKYVLLNPQCQIRVLDGKVLVEKAYVEKAKSKASWIVILVFLLFAFLMLARFFNWF